jgi:hypothetical protein
MTSLFTSQTPSSADNSDGAPGIVFATSMMFAVAGDVTGVRFYATTTVSGVYTGVMYQVTGADSPGPGTGTLLANKVLGVAPTSGTWNDIVFDTPVAVVPGVLYRFGVHSSAGRYVSTGAFFASDLVNGDITAFHHGDDSVGFGSQSQGTYKIDADWSAYPRDSFNSTSYLADVLFTAGGGGLTPVTSTLEVQWRVYNRVTSILDTRWRVFNRVGSTLDVRWRVYNRVVSLLETRWRVFNRVLSTLTVRWRVTPDVAPVTGNPAVLTAQRNATLAYIAYDPTTIELIPCTRAATPSGGFTEVDGTPRDAQSVKLIELAYDQRPTITVAGIERILDYHLMGRWDMAIDVGDYWIDEEGTRWDIVGFSEGWDYMTKAYASRHIPRGARP